MLRIFDVAQRQRATAKDPPATWAASYTGPRKDNQDHYGRADQETAGYDWRNKGCVYVLADGMGGLEFGSEAADLAVKEVIAHYNRRARPGDPAGSLDRAIQHANQVIYAVGEKRGSRMGSTIVACVLKDGKATIAHVGDSRAYHLVGSELKRCTRDHLYATDVLGVEDDDEAKVRPDGHKISRALGYSPKINCKPQVFEYSPPDKFLLSSDGFTEVLNASEIQECMTAPDPRRVVRGLWERAADRVRDNATAVAIFASGRRLRKQRRVKVALRGIALGGVAALVLAVIGYGVELLIHRSGSWPNTEQGGYEATKGNEGNRPSNTAATANGSTTASTQPVSESGPNGIQAATVNGSTAPTQHCRKRKKPRPQPPTVPDLPLYPPVQPGRTGNESVVEAKTQEGKIKDSNAPPHQNQPPVVLKQTEKVETGSKPKPEDPRKPKPESPAPGGKKKGGEP